MTLKTKSALLWLLFILAALALSLCSCGANYHLRRSEYHLKEAIAKGALIQRDTVWVEVAVPTIEYDTIVDHVTLEKLLRDTITIETTKYRVKIKYDTVKQTLYHRVFVQPDSVRTAQTINNTATAPKERYPWWVWAMFGFCTCFIILACLHIFRR